ncbi:FHA domain-containing protein [Marinimicrobium sp. UBA4509]|uniref:FHA domain-containing protein n=1 Tax=Marinimicrobium sp. UBA4509 TaxID=1946811 RepID=UPI00257D09B3|nr:FHA domain-containing protein [Marinimicrobium sp. UBA4509]
MLKLRARHNKHQSVWLVEPGVKVGRSATNDLILDHASVASLQFVIGVRADRLILKNRAPETPLRVNDKLIDDRCRLQEGDRITLGDLELEIIDPKKDVGQASPALTEWSLKPNSAALGSRVFPLAETTVVGRSSECDIHLAVAHLSRRHAQLQILDGLLYVKDLGSSNGTFLNGERVTEARVRRGDELRFDTLSFGVIGPSDDLGKTTVRSTAPARAPAAKASAQKPRVDETTRREAAKEPQTVQPQPTASTAGSERTARQRGWVGGLVLLGLLAAVVVVWLVKK